MTDKIPLLEGTEPAGETIEEYGERVVAMVRKDMLDLLPDDVIGSIMKSHLIFGKACAMKAVANAMEEMSASMTEARAAAPTLARKAASAEVFEKYAREMSTMLARFLPGGGSEWFKQIGDEYYVCPRLAGGELQRQQTNARITKRALFTKEHKEKPDGC